MKKIKIIIGADLVPTKTNENVFINGNIEEIIDKRIIKRLNDVDARIFNLETPLIDCNTPINKVGPILGTNYSVINGIKQLLPTYLNLANNHIMDHGQKGLKTTINTLKENKIGFGGIGKCLDDANRVWIKNIKGIKIGIYACAEHEFSIATINTPGANQFDFINSYNCVKDNKDLCDFFIVLYHGGKEYYPYPSPNLQRVCRNFIDNGADIVICQHSHCIGCEENYKNKKIVYGQGNFIFDMHNRKECHNGLLLELEVSNHTIENIDYIVLSKDKNGIKIADDSDNKIILKQYQDRSNEIKDYSFVINKYSEFALDNIIGMLKRADFFSGTVVFKIINKLTHGNLQKKYFDKKYLRKNGLKLQNLVECEAWRELLIAALKNYNIKGEE